MIARLLLGQAGLKADEADSGAVTLIQRFGSAANLNVHLNCLVAWLMYESLYKLHGLALHGLPKVALETRSRLITRRTESHVNRHWGAVATPESIYFLIKHEQDDLLARAATNATLTTT